VITMLEKLGFQSLVEQTVTSTRIPRAMGLCRFVLGIVLGIYIGFPLPMILSPCGRQADGRTEIVMIPLFL
jgi:formate-dependent nitrite reductase membrane component NrfD